VFSFVLFAIAAEGASPGFTMLVEKELLRISSSQLRRELVQFSIF
jgi:hypothetical protein